MGQKSDRVEVVPDVGRTGAEASPVPVVEAVEVVVGVVAVVDEVV